MRYIIFAIGLTINACIKAYRDSKDGDFEKLF